MKNFLFFITLLLTSFASSCDKADKDDVYPVIDMQGADAYPKDCDTLYIGESFVFRAAFSDNQELGAFSIDIHQNFDHHTHSSSIVECPLDPVKSPVNPFLFISENAIPAGVKSYPATETILITPDVDPGDYHMMVRLTDREGWQTLKGISVKVLSRP
jgi:hypothetical protein